MVACANGGAQGSARQADSLYSRPNQGRWAMSTESEEELLLLGTVRGFGSKQRGQCFALISGQLDERVQYVRKARLLRGALPAQGENGCGHAWRRGDQVCRGHFQCFGELEERFQTDRHRSRFVSRDSCGCRVFIQAHPDPHFTLTQAPEFPGLAQARGHGRPGGGRGGGHVLNGCIAGIRSG